MTRRWNGWGERETLYPLPETAVKYLQTHLGAGKTIPDASLEEVVKSVPDSSLPPHPLISTEKKARIEHARGQSLPDWIEMRSGKISQFPDGVCFPRSDKDVRTLIDFSQDNGIHLIPYGGGTSVLGHINATQEQAPTLTMDLSHLNRMVDLDDNSALATFDAGIRGIALETQLRARGYTLGHFPQSFEFSTLGGWIATRSAGQQSYYYGSIEDLFAGGIGRIRIGWIDAKARQHIVSLVPGPRVGEIYVEIPAACVVRREGHAQQALFAAAQHDAADVEKSPPTENLDPAGTLDDEQPVRSIASVCHLHRGGEAGSDRVQCHRGPGHGGDGLRLGELRPCYEQEQHSCNHQAGCSQRILSYAWDHYLTLADVLK